MKTTLFLLVLFAFTSINLNCQIVHPDTSSDTANIYLRCLQYHLEYTRSLSMRLQKTQPHVINIEEDIFVTEKLPKAIDSFKINYLAAQKIVSKAKEEDGIHLIVIRPVQIAGNSLIVNIIDYDVKFEKGRLFYSNGGGSSFEFKFDCAANRFVLTNKKEGGL